MVSWFFAQKALSRQEELKERARLLLEQARRDAAMKAGNKSVPNTGVAAIPGRGTNVCDVSFTLIFILLQPHLASLHTLIDALNKH